MRGAEKMARIEERMSKLEHETTAKAGNRNLAAAFSR